MDFSGDLFGGSVIEMEVKVSKDVTAMTEREPILYSYRYGLRGQDPTWCRGYGERGMRCYLYYKIVYRYSPSSALPDWVYYAVGSLFVPAVVVFLM